MIMVDVKTCLIEQENDPTQLRGPGKLIRFFVDSGDHVNTGEQYTVIEVRHFILLFKITAYITGRGDVRASRRC